MKEEPVDILDEQGHKTGQTMLKSEAHKRSLRHGGAHVWIYNSKGEVLLQKRHVSKVIRPNVWDVSAAGHIASGDTSKQTIIREAKEELGLNLNPQDLKLVGIKEVNEVMPGSWTHRVLNWTYITKMDLDISQLKLEDDEVSDIRWLPVDEFEAELKDPQKKKLYTPSRLEFYEEIIREIRKRIKNGKEN
jgi:isopentenyl-diphosphate delta-isomerase